MGLSCPPPCTFLYIVDHYFVCCSEKKFIGKATSITFDLNSFFLVTFLFLLLFKIRPLLEQCRLLLLSRQFSQLFGTNKRFDHFLISKFNLVFMLVLVLVVVLVVKW